MDGMSGLLCIGKRASKYICTLYLLLRIVSITIPPRIKFPGRSSGIPEDEFRQTFPFLRATLKAMLCRLVRLCHFSFVIVTVLIGMAPRWRLVSFFSAAMDALFFLTYFGQSLFYCRKEDFGGYGMCFPLTALCERGPSLVRDMIRFV